MQEYFNLDLETSYTLSEPQPVHNNDHGGLLKAEYQLEPNRIGPITILTPPLRCTKVRVDVVKNNELFRKCTLDLQITDNEWRFSQFLGELGDMNQRIILKRGREWFGYAFSPANLRHSYINLDTKQQNNEPAGISVRLGKNVLSTLDRVTAKSWRNQFLVLRLVYKGVLVKDGSFTELWHADQVFRAQPPQVDDEEEEEPTPVIDVEDEKPEEEVREIVIQKKQKPEEPPTEPVKPTASEETEKIIHIKKEELEKPPPVEEKVFTHPLLEVVPNTPENTQPTKVQNIPDQEANTNQEPNKEEEQEEQEEQEEAEEEQEETEEEEEPIKKPSKKKAVVEKKKVEKKKKAGKKKAEKKKEEKKKKEKTAKQIILSHNRKREW